MQAIKIDSFSTQIRYILHTLLYQSSPPKSLKIFRRKSECWREAKIKIQLSHAVKLDGSNNWTLFYFPNVYLGGGIYLQLRVGNWFAHFVWLNQQFCNGLEIFLRWQVLCACVAGIFLFWHGKILMSCGKFSWVYFPWFPRLPRWCYAVIIPWLMVIIIYIFLVRFFNNPVLSNILY